jgi:hypothetical protein
MIVVLVDCYSLSEHESTKMVIMTAHGGADLGIGQDAAKRSWPCRPRWVSKIGARCHTCHLRLAGTYFRHKL